MINILTSQQSQPKKILEARYIVAKEILTVLIKRHYYL